MADAEHASLPVPEGFWTHLRAADERLLILDYDGTLAPFTVDRANAWPYSGVREELAAIRDRGTRLVVITGRSIDNARRLLRLDPPPEIWGSHGHERFGAEGITTSVKLPAEVMDALRRGAEVASQYGTREEVEVKPACVAFHWRGKSEGEAAQLRSHLYTAWQPLTAHGLALHDFDGGLELRSKAAHKGSAVRQLLAELGTKSCAAYLGDDLTDEDAFAAMAGKGLSILVRPEWRETKADMWLKPPEQLLEFLTTWRANE